jgi:hypothetical protein
VGLSPVSVLGLCEQATPPITPRVRGDSRIPPSGDLLSSASACVGAWHPREAETRPLPPCPCLAPSPPPVTGRRWLHTFPYGKFEQGFLDEYGLAQVGFGPPFKKDDRTVCDLANNTCGSHHTHTLLTPADGPQDRPIRANMLLLSQLGAFMDSSIWGAPAAMLPGRRICATPPAATSLAAPIGSLAMTSWGRVTFVTLLQLAQPTSALSFVRCFLGTVTNACTPWETVTSDGPIRGRVTFVTLPFWRNPLGLFALGVCRGRVTKAGQSDKSPPGSASLSSPAIPSRSGPPPPAASPNSRRGCRVPSPWGR